MKTLQKLGTLLLLGTTSVFPISLAFATTNCYDWTNSCFNEYWCNASNSVFFEECKQLCSSFPDPGCCSWTRQRSLMAGTTCSCQGQYAEKIISAYHSPSQYCGPYLVPCLQVQSPDGECLSTAPTLPPPGS